MEYEDRYPWGIKELNRFLRNKGMTFSDLPSEEKIYLYHYFIDNEYSDALIEICQIDEYSKKFFIDMIWFLDIKRSNSASDDLMEFISYIKAEKTKCILEEELKNDNTPRQKRRM